MPARAAGEEFESRHWNETFNGFRNPRYFTKKLNDTCIVTVVEPDSDFARQIINNHSPRISSITIEFEVIHWTP
ncbi:hypothetical protein FRC03_002011 [Tulasnella sp. 419]|nr:hypothetical protein FRC03_002011 [Tulasnella sp. 419]